MSATDEAQFWTGIGPVPARPELTPGAAAAIAETLGYRHEPAGVDPVLKAAHAEIADLRAQLAQVDDLRDEIARLAPDNGHAPGTAELLSILDTARHAVADYPITDRCGCGPQGDRVRFHRRGAEQCRAAR